jgi:hypothetical protein
MATTTAVTAGEVMDRAAALLNDPFKTDYTYAVQLPYLNTAIDEMIEQLEESNSALTNKTMLNFNAITMEIGQSIITQPESPILPHYPIDLVEIQEVGERLWHGPAAGVAQPFTRMNKVEFIHNAPAAANFGFWSWEDQAIRFNPNGATTRREIQLKYISYTFPLAIDETTPLGIINCRSFLSYKTAALLAQFVGENEERAAILNDEANKALERRLAISNKSRQQMMTRHRPFRASYKLRGGW